VAGARVDLEREHKAVRETVSEADGSFTFESVAAGTYLVAAKKDGLVSPSVQVIAGEGEALPLITVVLEGHRAGSGGTRAQAMEFADSPNFTIAGVTDWTAAGGHGSDVSLRTSEALNRETLTLKPTQDGAAGTLRAAEREKEHRLLGELAAAPESLDANRQLGSFYFSEGRYQEALPLLQRTYEVSPADAANEADLALALKETGELAQARRHVEHAISQADDADVHRAAGIIFEVSGDALRAVREFALAVRADPSEQNYFAWGEELLQHRAVLQAKEVFEDGVKRYSKSSRLLTALGAAMFGGALYQQAAERLCEASDLDTNDAEPYRFMGRIEAVAPHFDSCMDGRLARYAEVHSNDALANYYYALDVWKQKGSTLDLATQKQVESLLTKAVTIDPKCSVGFLQLGNLRSSAHNYPAAIELYAKAIAADPQSSEAHYRLGVAYDRIGERAKAKEELATHDALERAQAAEIERQRKEIKQFVVEAQKLPSVASPP
jgi:tetratricopeptide (TPR) repeat protein